MTVIGIDPGKTGAMAALHDDSSVEAWLVPTMKSGKSKPAWMQWATYWQTGIEFAQPSMIVIEDVSARPGQGVTSMFTFGRTLGFAHGLVAPLAVPVHFVTPSVWKRSLGLLKADKAASREKFRELFPASAHLVESVGKGTAIAEAALIAYYGKVTYGK